MIPFPPNKLLKVHEHGHDFLHKLVINMKIETEIDRIIGMDMDKNMNMKEYHSGNKVLRPLLSSATSSVFKMSFKVRHTVIAGH